MRANRAPHFLAAVLLLLASVAPTRGAEFFTNRLDLIYAEFQHGSDQALILQIDDTPSLPGQFMQRRIPSPPLADILNEMDSAEFRASVAQALTNNGCPVPVPAYRVLGMANAPWHAEIAYHGAGLSRAVDEVFNDCFRSYFGERKGLHSRKYALESMELPWHIATPDNPASVPIDDLPRVPKRWLHTDPVGGTYIRDGDICWAYDWHRLGPGQLFDPKELDPATAATIQGAITEALEQHPSGAGGWMIYPEAQEILKTRYHLDWLSPTELNPGMMIDFGPSTLSAPAATKGPSNAASGFSTNPMFLSPLPKSPEVFAAQSTRC